MKSKRQNCTLSIFIIVILISGCSKKDDTIPVTPTTNTVPAVYAKIYATTSPITSEDRKSVV